MAREAGLGVQLLAMLAGLNAYWPAHSFNMQEAQRVVKKSLLPYVSKRSEGSSEDEHVNDYCMIMLGKLIELGWVAADFYVGSFHLTEEGNLVARSMRR